jgi:cell division transport system permease protein
MSGARRSRPSAASVFRHWQAHHAREARASLRRLAATPLSSLMTLLVVGLALALPTALFTLLDDARALAGSWNGQAQVSVYLHTGLAAADQQQVESQLAALPGVAHARLVTPAQALDEFRRLSGYGDALSLLDSNPLPPVVIVQPADAAPDAVKRLRDDLAARPEVDAADIDLAWVQRLAAMLELGQRLLLGLAGALVATVLLVIGNTIRLDFESRREEVRVLKLLGATDAFVRRPFLYTGLWTGLAGGLLACLAVAGFLFWLDGPVAGLARLYGSSFRLDGLAPATAAGLLAGSAVLGIVGAWLAVGRLLRAMEP